MMNNWKRLLSILLALIMLAGMAPVHTAEAACKHAWGPKDYFGRTPTCVEPVSWVQVCTKCNQERDGEDYGPHQWGSWQTTVAATCTAGGQQHRGCGLCEAEETRATGPKGHAFGEWYRRGVPTCTEPGLNCRQCVNCGVGEFEDIPATGHTFGEWYVVKAAQMGVAGLEERKCSACGLTEQRELPPLDGNGQPPVDNDQEPQPLELAPPTISIVCTTTPANGQFYVPGETASFTVTCTNPTTNRIPLEIETAGAFVSTAEFSTLFAGVMEPGKSLSASLNYTVTSADGYAGEAGYMAWAHWSLPATTSVSIETPAGSFPCGIEGADAAVSKRVVSTPANGEFYVKNETIKYEVVFQNLRDHELMNVKLTDPLIGSWVIGNAGEVLGGQSRVFSFSYKVTEEDVETGFVSNTASLQWNNYKADTTPQLSTNTVTVACGRMNPVTISKTVTSIPANGDWYVPGEKISFQVTVTNVSTVPLTFSLHDPLYHGLMMCSRQPLPAGDTATFTYDYTVTDMDALNGSVSNYAYGQAWDSFRNYYDLTDIWQMDCGYPDTDGDGLPDVPFGVLHGLSVTKKEESLPANGQYYVEGEVIHYTITYTNVGELPLIDVEIFDLMGGMTAIGSAEKLDPGESRNCYYQHTVTAGDVSHGTVTNSATGKFTVGNVSGSATSNSVVSLTSADGKPGDPANPGVIDTALLHGDDFCLRRITARDNASASYETIFCSAHALTQSTALMMRQTASSAELQQQAAGYATALWRAEVEKMYQQIFTAADPVAKANVMTEYICFLTDMANYEAMLKALYPDQPGLAAQMIAELWENKCVSMCGEIHAAAQQRQDSLLLVTASTGAAADACACTVTGEDSGVKAYTRSYCASHAFPFSMTDALLQGADTVEGWTMLRQIWTVELTKAYNGLYTRLGADSALAMAECQALNQWLPLREASLKALYPENPELVAQIMMKTVMDRVNDLCHLVK